MLAETHHLVPKEAHQHPSAATAIALERTTKPDANMRKTEMKRNRTKIPKRECFQKGKIVSPCTFLKTTWIPVLLPDHLT